MRLFWSTLLPALVWFGCSSVSAQGFTIHPPNPTTNDIIYINGSSGSGPISWSGVTRASDKLVIQDYFDVGFSAGGGFSRPFGLLPAGTYRLFLQRATSTGQPSGPEEFKLEFTVTSATAVQGSNLELEGVWHNPDHHGRALYVVQTPDSLAGALLGHDQNKRPTWYLMQGHWVSGQEFRGTLFRYSGTNLAQPHQPADQGHAHAGAITLVFASATSASATYHLGSMSSAPSHQDIAVPIQKAKYR